jgi:hypothetical protein
MLKIIDNYEVMAYSSFKLYEKKHIESVFLVGNAINTDNKGNK